MFTSFIQSFRPGARPLYRAPSILRNDVDNLRIWFDGSDASAISGNLPSITAVEGQSFTSIHPANSTGNSRPTYVTAGLNGMNTIQFNGTSAFLTINPFTDLTGSTGYTLFFLHKYDRTTNQRFVETNATGTSEMGFGIGTNGNYEYHMAGGVVDSGVAADTNWHLHSYTYNGTQPQGSRVLSWHDNVPVTTATETTTVGATMLSTSSVYIGCSDAQTLHSQGQWAEMVFFIRPLSAEEMEAVNIYLMKKWGIY